MLSDEQINFYQTEGYLIADVLSHDEIENLREKINDLISPATRLTSRDSSQGRPSSYQHFGDAVSDFGREPRHYYFHLMGAPETKPLHFLLLHQKIQGLVKKLLGPDLILNNYSLLAAEPGIHYQLGWHRDVIQIPEGEIDPRIFSKEWRHNNVQFNLALYDDSCLWAVPGSHIRPNTEEENRAFAGSQHYAPVAARMAGGVSIDLKPGQAAFYNNNLIHRGYSESMDGLRRTIHIGFHSGQHPPTWHFYLLDYQRLTREYLDNLDAEIRPMMERYVELRSKYPKMEESWPKRGRPLSEVLDR